MNRRTAFWRLLSMVAAPFLAIRAKGTTLPASAPTEPEYEFRIGYESGKFITARFGSGYGREVPLYWDECDGSLWQRISDIQDPQNVFVKVGQIQILREPFPEVTNPKKAEKPRFLRHEVNEWERLERLRQAE